MNKIIIAICSISLLLVSCNDFLDKEPITEVNSNVYLYSESDLAAYSTQFYNDNDNGNNEVGNILPSHKSKQYNVGLFMVDNGTDNQTAATPNPLFVKGQYHVNDDGDLWEKYFKKIRAVNYFLQSVPQRFKDGSITGNKENIQHYIGEVYFFRAYIYFTALQNLGDFPILTKVISENYDSVRIASERRPRNEVARFILSDLDKAYEYMKVTPPMSNRLTKDCATLVKGRVALFEGTWEKYHKGTPFVPGGKDWPGANAEYLKGFQIDIDSEINYFLQQAVEASDIIAQKYSLDEDYASMFNSIDLSGSKEILLWRKYGLTSGNTSYHEVVQYLQRNGGGNVGFTRSMVDSYLMNNGLPIYATGSGYKGDDTYEHLFDNRDFRMGQTILKTGDLLSKGPNLIEYIKNSDQYGYFYRSPIFEGQVENSCPTGYSLRKGLNTSGDMAPVRDSYTACPIFRASEAYLNYIEAYYELHHSLDAKCDTYWKALRSRAKVSTDYQNTISHTNMLKEKADWGSYSAGKQIDATLYNIRRERRIELVAEGFRLNDLKRWRSLDQVKEEQIQGCNFWESIYKLYTAPSPEDAKGQLSVINPVEYGTSEASNISSRNDNYAEGKYLLPYRKSKVNIGFNGLTWNSAKYLYPISNKEFRLTTKVPGSNDFKTSTIYQNPGWTEEDGTLPIGE